MVISYGICEYLRRQLFGNMEVEFTDKGNTLGQCYHAMNKYYAAKIKMSLVWLEWMALVKLARVV